MRELKSNPHPGLEPVGFLDDDLPAPVAQAQVGKHDVKIHGVPVLGDSFDPAQDRQPRHPGDGRRLQGQRQIAAGGPVTVTHPEMRRYFMPALRSLLSTVEGPVEATIPEVHPERSLS